jgi:hypothetical protein
MLDHEDLAQIAAQAKAKAEARSYRGGGYQGGAKRRSFTQ